MSKVLNEMIENKPLFLKTKNHHLNMTQYKFYIWSEILTIDKRIYV